MKRLILMIMTVLVLSCKGPVTSNKEDGAFFVSVISWNLQTFFDGMTEGTEYSQFKGAYWSEDMYKNRLETLCNFIRETEADVYVFQEIENTAILQDISNELVGLRAAKKGYEYSCFSKEEGDALGMAILSRYPLEDCNVHQIDERVCLGLNDFSTSKNMKDGTNLEQPRTRAILHAKVRVSEEKYFSLYSCHWKSKYGGADVSEVWRNAQERLLANLLVESAKQYLVVGDFNRTIEEFIAESDLIDGKVLLQGCKNDLRIASQWIGYNDLIRDEGSYYYENQWEKIDHIFHSEALEVIDFRTIKSTITANEDGFPYRYSMVTKKGSSDHLPLFCVLEL